MTCCCLCRYRTTKIPVLPWKWSVLTSLLRLSQLPSKFMTITTQVGFTTSESAWFKRFQVSFITAVIKKTCMCKGLGYFKLKSRTKVRQRPTN